MKKQARRGFTLPEILVTVTVVAVLAAVVVPAVTQYVNKGNAPSSQGDLDQLRTAITAYVADTRVYPTTLYDLTVVPTGGFTTATWKGPYTSAPLSTASTSATFTSSGLRIVLGPTITDGGGYLYTTIAFTFPATCQDLYDLDKAIDGPNTPTLGSTAGSVVWTDANCTATTTAASSASPIMRLMAKGS